MERENLFVKPLAGLCRDGPGRAAGSSRSDVTKSGPGGGWAEGPNRDAAGLAVRHLHARDPGVAG